MRVRLILTIAAVAAVSACAGTGPSMAPYSQAGLPAAVQVPAGHTVAMQTMAAGDITWQCRAKADGAGQFEWAFAGPDAASGGSDRHELKRRVHQRLLETLNLVEARRTPLDELYQECSRRVDTLLREQQRPLTATEKKQLLGEVMDEIFGLGPLETLESIDGSRITGTQLAVAPAGSGNIPLQLVKADPAMGMGAMQGVSHVQRVNTRGGVAPAAPCGAANLGAKQVVQYTADYVFWRVAM